MRIFVTGGAGFIGSNFVRLALNNNHDQIVVYDKLTYAANPTEDKQFSKNLLDVQHNKNFSFVNGDVCDKHKLLSALSGIDAVVHFAAESHVDRSLENPDVFFYNNVEGTKTLLECINKINRDMRVLHISTDEVYGSIRHGYARETDIFNPTSPYAQSKAEADNLALTCGENIVVTRSSNNFGPYQFPEKFISLSIINLILGEKIPIYGTGMNVRDWIYVEDNCDAIYYVLQHGKAGEAYNIGGGNEKTNIAIAQELIKLCDRDESAMKFVNDRPNHDLRYALSSDKITALGWMPKHSFNGALQKTVDWYKSSVSWWEHLKNQRYTSINTSK